MNVRSYPVYEWLLMGLLVMAGVADSLRIVSFGGVSGLAMMGILEAGIVWACWAKRPWTPVRDLGILAILLFTIFATGTIIWTTIRPPEVQPLTVLFLFVGTLLLALREAFENPRLPARIGTALDWMCILASLICMTRVASGPSEEDGLAGTRGIVIVMLIGICYQLALWQCGQTKRIVVAGAMALLILVSVSRTASMVGMVLFPLAVIFGAGRRGSPLRAIQVMVIGGLLFSCVFLYGPAHERFIGSTAFEDITTEGVDTSGRMEMWEDIFESWKTHPWLGQGVGTTKTYTDKPGMYHPHNDYLLIAHDYGVFGLALFLLGILSFGVRITAHLRRTGKGTAASNPADAICLTAVLTICTLLMMMTTDNPCSYAFVMKPLAILCAIGVAQSMRDRVGQFHRPQRPPIIREQTCRTF